MQQQRSQHSPVPSSSSYSPGGGGLARQQSQPPQPHHQYQHLPRHLVVSSGPSQPEGVQSIIAAESSSSSAARPHSRGGAQQDASAPVHQAQYHHHAQNPPAASTAHGVVVEGQNIAAEPGSLSARPHSRGGAQLDTSSAPVNQAQYHHNAQNHPPLAPERPPVVVGSAPALTSHGVGVVEGRHYREDAYARYAAQSGSHVVGSGEGMRTVAGGGDNNNNSSNNAPPPSTAEEGYTTTTKTEPHQQGAGGEYHNHQINPPLSPGGRAHGGGTRSPYYSSPTPTTTTMQPPPPLAAITNNNSNSNPGGQTQADGRGYGRPHPPPGGGGGERGDQPSHVEYGRHQHQQHGEQYPRAGTPGPPQQFSPRPPPGISLARIPRFAPTQHSIRPVVFFLPIINAFSRRFGGACASKPADFERYSFACIVSIDLTMKTSHRATPQSSPRSGRRCADSSVLTATGWRWRRWRGTVL